MRSGKIEIPVVVALTQVAVDQLTARGKQPGHVQTLDGGEVHGFSSRHIGTVAFQEMLSRNYLEKIEFSASDPDGFEGAIADLTKLVIYGLLYSRFGSELERLIFDSDEVRRWNRANPARSIDERTHFNPEAVKQLLASRSEELKPFTEGILARAVRWALVHHGSSEEAQERCEYLCGRYFECIPEHIWYIVLLLFPGDGRDGASRGIAALIERFVRTSGLADYFADTLNEVISHTHRTTMLQRAKMQAGEPVSLDQLTQDEQLRRTVVEAMADHHETLHVVWRIAARPGADERRRMLSVSLFDKEYEFEIIKSETDREKTMKIRDLRSHFERGADCGGSRSSGLTYLGHLADAARALGVHFEALAREDERLDFSMITMTLQF